MRSRNEARKREDEGETRTRTRTRAALSDSEDLDYKRRSHCAIAKRHRTARERGETTIEKVVKTEGDFASRSL